MERKYLKYLFLAGCLYFCCMAIAHFFGIKVPILFVYYDTPFYAYQDKIISFAVCAYIVLFYFASKHLDVALGAIVVLALTVLGLSMINIDENFLRLLKPEQSTLPYWLQTITIGIYAVVLIVFYIKQIKYEKLR